ncbi:uncharacterized protein [Argopecten irradians]|uniref:uncharacterized protein n=1 Tax=Argopecten irradians TaxID=31199 RepID=UPI0037169020
MELVDFESNPDHDNEMDGAEECRFQLSVSGEERPAIADRMNTIPVMANATPNGNDVIPQVSHLSTSPMTIPVSSYPSMVTPQQPTPIYPGTYSGNQGYMPLGQQFGQFPPGMNPSVPYSMSNDVYDRIQPPYMSQPPPGYSQGYPMFPYGYRPGMYPNYGYPMPPPPGYLTHPPPGYTAIMPVVQRLPQGQVLPQGHLGEQSYDHLLLKMYNQNSPKVI